MLEFVEYRFMLHKEIYNQSKLMQEDNSNYR